jgi:hypothetical protein
MTATLSNASGIETWTKQQCWMHSIEAGFRWARPERRHMTFANLRRRAARKCSSTATIDV